MEKVQSLKDLLKPLQRELDSRVRIREKWIRAGFTILPNALLLDKRISAQAKAVFALICLHAFNKEEAKVSQELLQEEIGLSRTQLSIYLRELKKAGLVEVIRTGRASKYEIIFSELDNRVDKVVAHLASVKERMEKRIEGNTE